MLEEFAYKFGLQKAFILDP